MKVILGIICGILDPNTPIEDIHQNENYRYNISPYGPSIIEDMPLSRLEMHVDYDQGMVNRVLDEKKIRMELERLGRREMARFEDEGYHHRKKSRLESDASDVFGVGGNEEDHPNPFGVPLMVHRNDTPIGEDREEVDTDEAEMGTSNPSEYQNGHNSNLRLSTAGMHVEESEESTE